MKQKNRFIIILCIGILIIQCLFTQGVMAAEKQMEQTHSIEEMETLPDNENVTETELETETESESETVTESETEKESENAVETEAEIETETEYETETESETESETVPESKTESETVNLTETEMQSETEAAEKAEQEFVFWAENEEQARQICDFYAAEFVSWQDGIGVLKTNEAHSEKKALMRQAIRLYPNYRYEVEAVTYDPEVNEQWHLELFQIDKVWKLSTGKNVKVAVIDSGIDLDHEALAGNLALAETVIPDKSYDSNGLFLASYKGVQDNLGHGTHVAGIIGANAEDGSVMGIAPECNLYSIKALERNGNTAVGYTSWIANAILRAVEAEVDIINLSVGGSRKLDAFIAEAIEIAAQKGCVVVCAVGNYTGSGTQDMIDFPALAENTIAVTAGKQDEDSLVFDSSYSKYGEGVDFIAPGTSIVSTVLNGSGTKRGTSMACPMVSAVYALLMELEPEMSAEKLTQVLRKTALDLGEKGKDIYYGDGLIQPLKALRTLKKQNSQEQETEKTENIGDFYQENTAGLPEYTENSDSVPEKTEPETEQNMTESIAAESPAVPDKTEIPAEPEENTESEFVSEPESTEDQTEDEKALEEQIDALKNKLDEIQPEEEVKYEIQEEQNDGEEKQKADRKNSCGLMMGAAILIIIIVWTRKRINSKKV